MTLAAGVRGGLGADPVERSTKAAEGLLHARRGQTLGGHHVLPPKKAAARAQGADSLFA
jgi:hypothetical protein